MHWFTLLFLLFFLAGLITQYYLLYRQLHHVKLHQDQVPHDFTDSITLEEHKKAATYTQAKGKLASLELLFGSLVLLGWTLGGGIDWLNQLWQNNELTPLYHGAGLILSFILILILIDLPLNLWRTFRLEAQFNFNRTTIPQFIKDLLLQILISIIVGMPIILTILWLMNSMGSLWWLWAWGFWMSVILIMSWAFPTFIAPLFNQFKPLDDGELKTRIQQLLDRCGFVSKGIFVMDGSKRSSHGNAYFTGLGKSKRIVFFDTLLDSLTPAEIEAVLAHELGHFKHKHITKGLIIMAISAFIGLATLGWLGNQVWFYHALGVNTQSNALALLLFMMIMPVFTQFISPAMSWFQRKHEFEADTYAAQQTDANDLISALVKMYRENAATLTPDPLYSAWHDSHPPASVRIAHLSHCKHTS